MKATDLRKGSLLIHNAQPHRVMEFHHHTPGNLRAMVQVKMRNMMSGNQTDVRYSCSEELEEADARTTPATYVYSDNTGFHFMMSDSYEEMTVSSELLGDQKYYLQDQMPVQITIWNGEPIGIELPEKVTLLITETQPEIRGGTASNSPKPAICETGLQVMVPTFIKQGERIVVNTTEGKYLSRAE